MSNKLWYGWEEMRRDVNSLCREITLDKFDPNVIVGLSRGGLTPGVMMSHWMKKPFKSIKAALRDHPEWEDYLPRKSDKQVLIVDDVCDSGETFQRISNFIKERSDGVDVRFAVLYWNNECNFTPHYYVNSIAKDSENIWIHFPWESWWNTPV
ncbi:purine phosphoribosyltransferase [Marine Group I thaumarchaeote]|jgi:hypoxanthine phosphoribosyltransferase|uniref:Purine phosphoribosyltransferase n=1 Tax=Marine Group I thaumarchaeote TaxID=2511932 RepID=A0A7K4MPF4_9ARCH|nr:purine phosphoribosyltransferase [Marine Group I thaumarchaeote]